MSSKLILLALISLLFLGTIILLSQNKQNLNRKNKTSNTSSSATQASQNQMRKDEKFTEENTYLIKLSRKPNTKVPEIDYLPQYLAKLLELNTASPSINPYSLKIAYNSFGEIPISYDTRYPKPIELVERPFKRSYYLLMPHGSLNLNKSFEDNGVIATIEKAKTSVLPYLNNGDFCHQDSDCHAGMNMCSYGVTNYYKQAIPGPYGCGQAYDGELAQKTGENYVFGFEQDPKLGCVTDVKYSDIKCVNNSCVANKRNVSCRVN